MSAAEKLMVLVDEAAALQAADPEPERSAERWAELRDSLVMAALYEIPELLAELEAQAAEAEELQRTALAEGRRADDLQRRAAEAETHLETEAAREQIRSLQAERDALRVRCDHYREALEQITQARSWRPTAAGYQGESVEQLAGFAREALAGEDA